MARNMEVCVPDSLHNHGSMCEYHTCIPRRLVWGVVSLLSNCLGFSWTHHAKNYYWNNNNTSNKQLLTLWFELVRTRTEPELNRTTCSVHGSPERASELNRTEPGHHYYPEIRFQTLHSLLSCWGMRFKGLPSERLNDLIFSDPVIDLDCKWPGTVQNTSRRNNKKEMGDGGG